MNHITAQPASLQLQSAALCLMAFALFNSCDRGANKGAVDGGTAKAAEKQNTDGPGQVVISPAEQTAQRLEIESASIVKESGFLRLPGRIVLPDDASWRVGVLVEGRVESVSANLGDYVHKGQMLAQMHSHEVHEARAAYQMAVSDRLKFEAAQALAQRSYDRAQRLLGLKAASVQEVEQAKQELINAQTAYENSATTVQRERVHLEDTLGIPAVAIGTPNGTELDLIPIKAPAAGYILQKNVTPGSTIQPSTDAFVIGALHRLWMIASVTQDDLNRLHLGQEAVVSEDTGQTLSGRVTNLGQQSDPTTRLVQVRIDITNKNNRLRPEMLVTARIPIGSEVPMLSVPEEAIQQVNGADVVFIRSKPDRFEIRPVRRGAALGNHVQILEGIRSGDAVVTRGSFIVKSQLLKSSFPGE